MLVQKLPTAEENEAERVPAWDEAQRGIERVSAPHLLMSNVEAVLAGGFPGHDLRLFRGARVTFECRCSPRAGRRGTARAGCGGDSGRAQRARRRHGDVRVLPTPVPF